MGSKRDPDSQPISVEELIARSNSDAAFPRSESMRVRPASTDADSGTGATASGMPSYTSSTEKKTDETASRVLGASGMPDYVRSTNAVTGIIPVVTDGGDDEEPVRPVPSDDLLGEDLPAAPAADGGAAADATAADGFTADGFTDIDVASTGPIARVGDGDGALDAGTVTAGTGALDSGVDDSAALDTAALDAGSLETGAAGTDADEPAGDHLASAAEVAEATDDENALLAAQDEQPHERAAIWGWLGLIGEVVLGLAVGAGIFWGFTVLWKEYIYLALILAVLVIFAIVTFTYALRKRDLPTTLLALGVGLLITIGPLVMLV
ncbi:hypothetical protein [Gordonia sp. VNK21]|uniref:hypothetical protein n=1 Tax=Gordonia sp. VNK21 TaxID=3382483 RepID=UPI0038D458B0